MRLGISRQLFELRFQGWKKAVVSKIAFIAMSFIFIKGVLFFIGQIGLFFITCAVLSIILDITHIQESP
jgi:hypothetical protein